MIEDLTGLGKAMEGAAKIADSQLANKTYDDGFQEPVRQTGELTTDILKSLRLFLAPFQLAAAYQDRLKAFCERVRAGVPEERQVAANPGIAGPVLVEMRFIEETSPLADMYEKLLQKAIDRDQQDLAHPAFVKIVSQLSADEILVLERLRENDIQARVDYVSAIMTEVYRFEEKDWMGLLKTDIDTCLVHLIGLSLVSVNENCSSQVYFGLNRFGEKFISACRE